MSPVIHSHAMRMYQCWYCSKACSLSSHRVPMSVKCIYDVHSHQHSQARDSVRTTGEASHSKWELEWMRFAMSGLPWPHTAPSSMSSRTYFVFFHFVVLSFIVQEQILFARSFVHLTSTTTWASCSDPKRGVEKRWMGDLFYILASWWDNLE